MKKMQDDILKVLLSEEEILAKVQEIGRQITEDYTLILPSSSY